MAQTKQQIQSLLSQVYAEPRKRFGQNFMIDQNLVRLVAESGRIGSGDVVIEVGPGTGTLTEELIERAGRVIAVEIDRDLARLLRERLTEQAKFTLIEGDALAGKHGLNEELIAAIQESHRAGQTVKLVANLPYNIASPLIIELLISGVEMLAFTVQKEVADRLRSNAGDEAYGGLTVMVQLLGRVEVLRTLPPQAFWPPPKIDSSLVRIVRDNKLGADAAGFGAFIQQLFSFRRKTVRKALANMNYDADVAMERLKLDPQHRPEVIAPAALLELYRALRDGRNASH